MKPRNVVIAWIAFALPVLILAAVLWRGPGDAAAQQKIVDIVRRLEDAGEIIIAGRGGEKEERARNQASQGPCSHPSPIQPHVRLRTGPTALARIDPFRNG